MIRRALLLAGLAVLTTGAGRADTPATVAAAAPTRFAPPRQPLLLTRLVIRYMADGATISVARTYRIRFVRDRQGWQVEGSQTAVDVKTPPILEPLAQIERNRRDDALFPMMLDAHGMVVTPPPPPSPETARQVNQAGSRIIGESALSAGEKQQAQTDLKAIIAASRNASVWPVDLFNPVQPEQHQTREFDLGNGQRGTIVQSLAVSGFRPGRVPTQVTRELVTTYAGTKRTSREIWTFAESGR